MRLAILLLRCSLLAACATTEPPGHGRARRNLPQRRAGVVRRPARDARSSARACCATAARASCAGCAKGMMVTMDFRDDRLTVYLDAANRVERANCG